MTLADSGHVTVSYTIGSEGQGRVSNTYRVFGEILEDAEDRYKSWSREGQEEGVSLK